MAPKIIAIKRLSMATDFQSGTRSQLAQGMIIINKEKKPIINKQARMIISFFSSIMVELLMHTSVHIKAIDKENYSDNYNSTIY